MVYMVETNRRTHYMLITMAGGMVIKKAQYLTWMLREGKDPYIE